MKDAKDFILAIENLEIDILKIADELDGYELSDIKRHARNLSVGQRKKNNETIYRNLDFIVCWIEHLAMYPY